jgi:uncharacterized membrane protein YkvA (DUF1232 family)
MTLVDVGRYVKSPLVPWWRKALVLVAAAYVVMPADLIPDVIPLLGWLDDVGVVGVVLTLLARDMKRVREAAVTVEGTAVPSSPKP